MQPLSQQASATLPQSSSFPRVAVVAREVGGFVGASRGRLFSRLLGGHCAEVVFAHDGDPLDPDTLVFLDGNPLWFPRTIQALRELPAAGRPPVVAWHTEPLPLPEHAGFPRPRLTARERMRLVRGDPRISNPSANARGLLALRDAGVEIALAVSSRGAQEYLAAHGIAAAHVPFGGSPWLGADLGRERDVDVVFVGDCSVPRRRRCLQALRQAGVAVVARGSWGADGLWGDARTEFLNRAKILLNFGRFPGQLSGARLALGMTNGCLVVSEPIYRPDPWVAGEHFVSAPLEELPDAIGRVLADDEERRRITAAGHRLVAEHVTLERALGQVLATAEAAYAGA